MGFTNTSQGEDIKRSFKTYIDTLHIKNDFVWQLHIIDTTIHINGMRLLPNPGNKYLKKEFFQKDTNSVKIIPERVPTDVVHYPFKANTLYNLTIEYRSTGWNNRVTVLHLSSVDTVIYDIARCPTHHVWMETQEVKIEYGYGTTSWWGPPVEEKNLFPYRTRTSIGGGCIITDRTHIKISVCPKCDEAFENWLDADCSDETYLGEPETFAHPIGGFESIFISQAYPSKAERSGREVVVEVTINCEGKVSGYSFLRGSVDPESIVLQDLLRSKWEPATIHGGRKKITMRFSMSLPVIWVEKE